MNRFSDMTMIYLIKIWFYIEIKEIVLIFSIPILIIINIYNNLIIQFIKHLNILFEIYNTFKIIFYQ